MREAALSPLKKTNVELSQIATMDIGRNITNYITSNLKFRMGPAGLHLFNRKTGMNILVEEFKPPINMWASAPRQVSIALTNACDLKCPHCYAPKNPAILNFELLKSWLTDLDANGCIGVGFGGGEPTIYPGLVELCSFAANKTTLAVTMTTHAHRLSNRLLSELAGNLHFIRVSMDGIGSTYESIRGCSFHALLDRINALRRISSFGINYLVNSKTIKDLDTAVRLAEDLGASEFLLLPEEPVGRGKGIDKVTNDALKKWVKEYRGTVPLSISENRAEGFPTCNPFKNEKGLQSYAHIDASGFIKLTSYDSSGIYIGRKGGLMVALEKLNSKKQEEFK